MDLVDQREAFNNRQHRADLFFDQAPASAFRLDQYGVLLDVNQRWYEVLGYARESVVGLGFAGFLAPAYRECFQEGLSSMELSGDVRHMH
jgi:PAS domain S-box-containing protein